MKPNSGNEVDEFREHLRHYDRGLNAALADLPTDVLQEAIDQAKSYIGSLRMSWHAVATNYLQDGRCHP